MRFDIPNRVRITHKISYEVCYVDLFTDPSQLGECRYDTKQILIRQQGQSIRQMFSTFVHESLHAVNFETPGANLTEKQVLALEKGLMRLLRLNKLYE